MATPSLLAQWFPDHTPKAPTFRGAPAFFRNLEEIMDRRRKERSIFLIRSNEPAPNSIDFTTLDFLGLNKSGLLRVRFLEELAAHPGFRLGSGGSRILNGNNPYLELVELEIAAFHKGESALLFHSGFEANMSIITGVAHPGDAIVYDELGHASMLEGTKVSLAAVKATFKHNDVDDFRETLQNVLDTNSLIKEGKRNILIYVETMYSMDGDFCPLRELVQVAKEVCPEGNAQFVVDEAHTTGVLGKQGRGYVNQLGLEKDIAIRMHTCGKGLASTGAAVICNSTVREVLINYAHNFQYSTAVSFPTAAAIRAGYKLLSSGKTEQLQEALQANVKYFFRKITTHEVWDEATDEGVLSIPLAEDWESRPFQMASIPVMTRHRYTDFLCYHIQLRGCNAFTIDYPIVPRGKSRLRLVFHAYNTAEEIDTLVNAICAFAQEVLDLEGDGKAGAKIPSAARLVQAVRD